VFAKLTSLMAGLFRRSQVETDLTDEIRFHIETRAADIAACGVDPDEALRRARLEFGGIEKYKEAVRRARGLGWFDELRGDFLHGSRTLLRSKAFTIAAAISLALGIGANTLIFSMIDSIFLRPLRYRDPGRLAVIWSTAVKDTKQTTTSSVSTYFGLRDQSQSFESVGAFNGGGCGIRSLGADSDSASAERIFGQCFSPTMFQVLGVKPQIGRPFTDEEDQVGNVANVVLISDGLWKRRFGGDPGILGKTLTLNKVPTSVIGVMPADFELFKDPNSGPTRGTELDFILPLELTPTQVQSKVGGLTIVGRMKPQVSVLQAQSEIETVAARLAISDPERHQDLTARVEPFRRAAYRDYRSPLFILEGAVAFVLLISCANVAGLLLARASGRRTEVALRMALGGSRWRIVRQLVTENLPVALLGGAIGLFLAYAGLNVFVAIAPRDFPRLDQVSLDLRVLGFTALTVILTGILSAVVPAVQIAKVSLVESLKENSRSASSGINRVRMRSALVMGQVALAMILLTGAGLMIHSFFRVMEKDLGGDPRNLLTFDFRLTQNETVKPFGRYKGMGLWDISPVPAQKFERVLERLQEVPGVTSVAAVSTAPFGGSGLAMPFFVEGTKAAEKQQTASYFAVTRGFFGTMRIPFLKGRDFTDRDTADAPPVIIINETTARRFFPNEDPIGKHITLDWVPNERPREIIGVVGDIASGPLQREQEPSIYVPHLQQTSKFTGPAWFIRAGMYFVLRTSVQPAALLPSVKAAVAEIDRNTPIAEIRTAEDTIQNEVRNLRLYMLLLGVFGAVATILAATGIYGVMAYFIAERKREIGIRIALGAGMQNVLRLVFRQATFIIGIGFVAGLAGAVALSRVLQSTLFGISATDVPTYVVVSGLLLCTGFLACFVPTRRALSVDPTISLKD
jgi:putative ABC transport system permease protein